MTDHGRLSYNPDFCICGEAWPCGAVGRAFVRPEVAAAFDRYAMTEPETACQFPGCGLPRRLHGAPPGEQPNPTRSTHHFLARPHPMTDPTVDALAAALGKAAEQDHTAARTYWPDLIRAALADAGYIVVRAEDVERLVTLLDNLATHHELERTVGNTHSRPERCEFVEQARAALATKETP